MADTAAPGNDPLAAALKGIRERWSKVAFVGLKPEVVPEPGPQPPWLPDVPRLLAAVQDGALKLADGWEQDARRLDAIAAGDPDPQSRIAMSLRAQALEDCARALREAITAALAGEEAGDG